MVYVGVHFLLWIPAVIAAWFPSRASIVFISVRLGLFAAFLAIALALSAASSPLYGPQGLILILVEILLVVTLASDFLVWVAALFRNAVNRKLGLVLAPSLFAVLMIGTGAGATVWSELLPNRILGSAREFAGERAYCIMSSREVVTTRRDLAAWTIWWRRGQLSPDMHSILVIDDPNGGKAYANWSFSAGRFMDLTPSAFNVLEPAHIDCQPQRQFAQKL